MSEPAAMTRISAQVPSDLVQKLEAIAKKNERSLSAEVRRALRDHVDADAELAKPAA